MSVSPRTQNFGGIIFIFTIFSICHGQKSRLTESHHNHPHHHHIKSHLFNFSLKIKKLAIFGQKLRNFAFLGIFCYTKFANFFPKWTKLGQFGLIFYIHIYIIIIIMLRYATLLLAPAFRLFHLRYRALLRCF